LAPPAGLAIPVQRDGNIQTQGRGKRFLPQRHLQYKDKLTEERLTHCSVGLELQLGIRLPSHSSKLELSCSCNIFNKFLLPQLQNDTQSIVLIAYSFCAFTSSEIVWYYSTF